MRPATPDSGLPSHPARPAGGRGVPCACAAVFLLAAAVGGCGKIRFGGGSSQQANIDLRRENQDLQNQVVELKRRHDAQASVIEGLRARAGALPTLPSERLGRLFTTHGLKFGRLTGGWDSDRRRPGDEGLKVQVVPVDGSGDEIKAAGSFVVELFDTSRPHDARIGRWEFSAEEAAKHWHSLLMQYNYTFNLPWQTPPGQAELHLEVTFLDELTQTPFKHTADVKVKPPATPPSGDPTLTATTAPARPNLEPAGQ